MSVDEVADMRLSDPNPDDPGYNITLKGGDIITIYQADQDIPSVGETIEYIWYDGWHWKYLDE